MYQIAKAGVYCDLGACDLGAQTAMGIPTLLIKGGEVVFLIGPESRRQIGVAQAAGSRVLRRMATGGAGPNCLAASPDGRTLYYSHSGKIWAMPMAGGGQGHEIPVESGFLLDQNPLPPNPVGKDGRILTALSTASSWYYLPGLLDPRTGHVTRIPTDFEADYFHPVWDSQGRVVAAAMDARARIWRVRPETAGR